MKSIIFVTAMMFSGAIFSGAQTMSGPEPIASSTETSVLEAGPHPLRTMDAAAPEVIQVASLHQKAHIETDADRQKHDAAMKHLWMGSLGALVGANVLDVVSSWGKQEGNPLLRSSNGTFGAKGLGIKSGIVGASLLPEYLLRDHTEMRKAFAIINFAEAAYFSSIALHNFTLPAPGMVK